MAKNQKHYTPEFKQQLVDLYNAGGTSYPRLEREYGVNRSPLSCWVKQLSPVKISEEESVTLKEYKALQKENNRDCDFYPESPEIYTISQLCSALKFPRSTYYKALVRVPSNRQKEYEEFSRKGKFPQ